MRTRTRVLAGTALTAVGLLAVGAPAYAALPAPAASAYVVSADAVGTLVSVPAQPASTYPSGGTSTLAGIHLGPFNTASVLTATTTGDPTAGTSSASSSVSAISLNLIAASASLNGVNATCTATPTGATGSGTITSGSVTVALIPINLPVGAAPNTGVSLPGLGSVVLNEQSTDANGVLTVNAAHFTLLPTLNGANVVIGHAQCGGADPATAVPMISPKVAAAGGGLAVAGLAALYLQRRRRAGSLG
ncbi:choice-of-anchor P family protein [Kitasatospora sp. NPDC101183]|uniref:choice-of-anchor P family protein n=1 Tax=Kitasatospora sp. NPDC101183 TaxID=3364100 RepID=UPI0037F10549